MNPQEELEQLKKDFAALSTRVDELGAAVNKNNFSATQAFNKAAIFSDRLRVPVFDSAPSVAEIGDIFSLANGELYICTDTSPVTWTLVGSQT